MVFPCLRRLPRICARTQRSGARISPSVSDKTIEKLELERHQLTFEYEKKSERFAEIEPSLVQLKEEREHLTRELASFGAGSQALLQEQFEQIKNYERGIEQGRLQLEELMMKDIALALSGLNLREGLKVRLPPRRFGSAGKTERTKATAIWSVSSGRLMAA